MNPIRVKQTKGIEDNGQLKDDTKDPKLIANLVKDGLYKANKEDDYKAVPVFLAIQHRIQWLFITINSLYRGNYLKKALKSMH